VRLACNAAFFNSCLRANAFSMSEGTTKERIKPKSLLIEIANTF
jgi:hypothetical protein